MDSSVLRERRNLVSARVPSHCKKHSIFVMSVRPQGTTRLPHDGFWRILIFEYISKICQVKFRFYYNLSRITCVLWRWIFRMRNILGKRFRENRNTHFMFNNFYPKIVSFMRYCGNMVEAGSTQMTIWYAKCALHAGQLRLQRHTEYTGRFCR